MTVEPTVQWVAPASLWAAYAQEGSAQARELFRQPHILRFATDSFMDEFMGVLQSQPERLGEWRAEAETWEGPAGQPRPVASLPPLVQRLHRLRLATATPLGGTSTALASSASLFLPEGDLKLYQPAHMRYYLVTACLVCRLPGLPDRAIDAGAGEQATYVVRRLRPKAGAPLPAHFDLDTCDEYAFVQGNRWDKAANDALVPGEEQLPMFGVSYTERDGRRRRVLAAPIPVGKRESYVGAAAPPILADTEPAPPPVDPRKALLLRMVTDPWRKLIEQEAKARNGFSASGPPGVSPGSAATQAAERVKAERAARDGAVWLSWLTLLDLGDYLAKHVPAVWDVIEGPTSASTLSGTPGGILYATLAGTFEPSSGLSLAQTLVRIRPFRPQLDGATIQYSTDPALPAGIPKLAPADLPDFVYPFFSAPLAALVNPPAGSVSLDDQITAALPTTPAAAMPALPVAAQMSTLDLREPPWFIIRCVFERPNCVPLTAALLGDASVPFQMASFFDPQAPARPIRINLPLDTSAAGLRKFDRNTAFMISDVLCGQMNRMNGLTLGDLVMSVLPWPLHKDLPSGDVSSCKTGGLEFGMICSLSIPIITICALIMLIIIVNLLDIIFRWIPFFITCFPLPRFKGKGGS